MEHEEHAVLPASNDGSEEQQLYEFNDIGLALRLNALREPEPEPA